MENMNIEATQYSLIAGEFSPHDARDILLNLLNEKINFHKARDWSSQERLGKRDTFAIERIEALKASRDAILKRIAEAEQQGLNVRLMSNISIEAV